MLRLLKSQLRLLPVPSGCGSLLPRPMCTALCAGADMPAAVAAPVIAKALPIVGQLLGGLLGRRKEKPISAGDNAYSHVQGIMRAATEFGWNPLTLMGSVSPVGGTPGYTDNAAFGNAIANAAMLASDSISAKRATAQKLNNYQTQNTRLTRKVNSLTMRPPVPGLYGRARQPSDPEVYGNAGTVQPGGSNAVPAAGGMPYRDAVKAPSYNWLDPDIMSQSDDGSRVPRKPLFLGGYGLEPVSGTSDAEAIGSRYGEDFLSPSWFAGWGAFGYDAFAAGKKAIGKQWKVHSDAFKRDLSRVPLSPQELHALKHPTFRLN